jgi:hypothetical protein
METGAFVMGHQHRFNDDPEDDYCCDEKEETHGSNSTLRVSPP